MICNLGDPMSLRHPVENWAVSWESILFSILFLHLSFSYICVCVYMCMCTYINIYMYIYVSINICIYRCIQICTLPHARHTHTYSSLRPPHSQRPSLSLSLFPPHSLSASLSLHLSTYTYMERAREWVAGRGKVWVGFGRARLFKISWGFLFRLVFCGAASHWLRAAQSLLTHRITPNMRMSQGARINDSRRTYVLVTMRYYRVLSHKYMHILKGVYG